MRDSEAKEKTGRSIPKRIGKKPSRKQVAKRGRRTSAYGRFFKKFRWAIWLGGITAGCIYVYLFYHYAVAPFSLSWQALYGEPNNPEGYPIRGIDISHHQGSIDWDELSRSPIGGVLISFVFIKATEGKSLLDENFNDNFFQAGEYGLIRGAYHFYSPTVPAREQADYYIKQVHLTEGDLPPVLDIETVGRHTTESLRKEILAWLEQTERHYKVKPIIYTYYKFKQKYLDTPEFDSYPYWIAHYYVEKLDYKGEWKFWQYTDCGRIAGIKGAVDLNIYNGSMYDLRKLTIGEEEAEN